MSKIDLSYLNSRAFKITLCITLPVFLIAFIMIFLPFGVSNYNPNHEFTTEWMLDMIIFSLVTFFVVVFNEFILKKIFIKELHLINLIFWTIWSFIFYGIANFLTYNYIGDWHDLNFQSGFIFVLQLSAVFLFPMAGVLFFYRFKFLRSQYDNLVSNSRNKIDPSQLITFKGQGQNETIILSTDNFLYAKAADNYVELFFFKNEKFSKYLIRATLNQLTAEIPFGYINRCHRSYMINLFQVVAIAGGTSNFKLTINGVARPILVSKTYAHSIMAQLIHYKDFN